MQGLKDTLARHKDRLHALTGCTAVAIGRKIIAGEKTDQPCITVFVEAKRADPPGGQRVPATINGVPTDVVEQIFALRPIATDPNAHFDPLIGGISMASAGALGGGSLGCFIRTDGGAEGVPAAVYALTNFHVLQNGAGGVDLRVLQPFADAVTDQVMGTYVAGYRGLDRDCAISTIHGRGYRNQVPNHPLRFGNRDIGANTAVAQVDDRVYKYGATTRHTVGTVTHVGFAIENQVADAIYIRGEDNGLWCGPGDSGSIALRYNDDSPIGLIFMEDAAVPVTGGSGAGLAYDIQAQMNLFGNNVVLA